MFANTYITYLPLKKAHLALSGIKEQAYREHVGCVLLNFHSAVADILNTLPHLAYSLSAKSTCLSLS